MIVNRKDCFEAWYSKYGTAAKCGRYFQALRDPHYVLNDRATNPVPGYTQSIDYGLFPFASIYEVVDLDQLRTLFESTPKTAVADDGSMHTAIGNYALWLRITSEDPRWINEPLWDGDDVPPGSGAKSRIKTLNSNGFDYLKVLENRKATYMYDKYLAAIRTKPFVLLAGISGTGKSRMVRQLARGCCPAGSALVDEQKPGNFELISVRPNWHDSTELMGYVTRITGNGAPKYNLTPFVRFLVKASLHKDIPFFLCLDEMNLAPVEQYFAEFLSKIETRKKIGNEIVTDVLVEFGDEVREAAIEELLKPYKPAAGSPIPQEVVGLENAMKADKGIRIPPNLVVMGTVNMDETTCSFSRKVLDRAMSFELNDVEDMYTISTDGDPDVAWGAFNDGTVCRARQTYVTAENLYSESDEDRLASNMQTGDKVLKYLKSINSVLDKTPFKVAYRTRNEMMLYCVERGGDIAKALDEVTSMKILSRIEGDENAMRVTAQQVADAKVVATPTASDAPKNLILLLKKAVLKGLGILDGTITGENEDEKRNKIPSEADYAALAAKYRMCSEKLEEMNVRLISGYTGFWR